MENTKDFLKKFLKLKILLGKQNDENIKKYKKFINFLKKDLIIEELSNKKETNFLIRTQWY